MKQVLLRADHRQGDKETARLLELELAERHVRVTWDMASDDLGAAVFVTAFPSAGMLADIERLLQNRSFPILCCCWESDEALPSGVIRIERPFPVARFCDSLAQTVKDGKTESLLPSADLTALSLDPITGTVTFGKHRVSLTKKEAALLALLFERRGIPVSREEALLAVWGAEAAGDTNVVDVYIRYLRQKLDERFDTRFIRTVRGKGYLLK